LEAPAANAAQGRDRPPAIGYNAPQPLGFHRLTAAMNAAGTLWILALMVLINADVLGRDLFSAPIRGVTEVVSLSIVAIVFLQLADTLRTGRFTRSDALLGRLVRRRPRLARLVQAVFHLAGAALLAVLAAASWPLLADSWATGEYLGAIGDFQARLWPMRALIVLGAACTAITFLFLAVADLRVALARGKAP
jgi:TRAP-type mannitol/chloroaromatic compound transport system permease small subunit